MDIRGFSMRGTPGGVKRRLFTIMATMSLALFVGVAALWIRSYWRADFVEAERVDAINPNRRPRSFPSAFFSSRVFELMSQSGRLAAGVSIRAVVITS